MPKTCKKTSGKSNVAARRVVIFPFGKTSVFQKRQGPKSYEYSRSFSLECLRLFLVGLLFGFLWCLVSISLLFETYDQREGLIEVETLLHFGRTGTHYRAISRGRKWTLRASARRRTACNQENWQPQTVYPLSTRRGRRGSGRAQLQLILRRIRAKKWPRSGRK